MLAPQRLQWPINKLMGSAGEGQPGSRSAASKDCPAQPLWRGFCVKAAYTELAPDRFCVKSPDGKAGQISLSQMRRPMQATASRCSAKARSSDRLC